MKKTVIFASIILAVGITNSVQAADTFLQEYEKAEKEGRLDEYRESVEKYGGTRTKEEFNKIDKAQPGDTFQDTDKAKYIKRCGYGNLECTWERVN
jgi:uncharacterized membrane-anchored protein